MLPRNLHDALLQRAFDSPAEVEGFLRAVLPPAFSQAITPGSLKLIHARKTGDDLRSRVPDFLCTAEVHGTEMLLSVVVEHQSQPDPSMALRMLGSVVKLWQQHARQQQSAGLSLALPPILPIVIFHGEAPWKGTTSTLSMVALPPGLRAKYRRYQPRADFVLVDLSSVPDQVLSAAAMSAFARLALLLLKHGRSPDLLQRMASLSWLFLELTGAADGWDAIEVLLGYIVRVAGPITTQGLGEALAPALGEKGKEVAMTLAERLIAEGEQRGIEKGIEKGIEMGRLETLRENARRMHSRSIPLDQIAELLGVPVDEARELLKDPPHAP